MFTPIDFAIPLAFLAICVYILVVRGEFGRSKKIPVLVEHTPDAWAAFIPTVEQYYVFLINPILGRMTEPTHTFLGQGKTLHDALCAAGTRMKCDETMFKVKKTVEIPTQSAS